jgi:hypothetical protein
MAARSIESLTIAFGLVAIPVKLYSATVSSERLRFHMLHEKDGSRLKQQYVCIEEQKVVGRDEIVKGYEFAKDQYVMFTPEELKAFEEAGTHSVDVMQFVPLAAVDPVYFELTTWRPIRVAPSPSRSSPRHCATAGAAPWVVGRVTGAITSSSSGRSATRWRCTNCTSRLKCSRSKRSASRARRFAMRS